MNNLMSALLLLSVPGLPLLLAFPALRSRLPRPCYIALLPAILMVAVPHNTALEIPWLLFGATLAIDAMSRLLLAMSVMLWAASAALLHTCGSYSSDDRLYTYFMLTLAGNLGAILSADPVSFFVFLTLTGYGFYALLVSAGGEHIRQTGRIYLSFMILADLMLLEALLIAAAATDDFGFEAVRQAISQSSALDLYLLMVVIGFAARTGFWPLHFWLMPAFRSSRPAAAVLLGGVPVAIGLLGIVRWLPLGEISAPVPGMIIQSLGAAAMLYAILAGLIRAQLKMLPAYAAVATTGFYVIALGTGLADPALWKQYGHWVYIFIAAFGIGSALLVIASWRLESKYSSRITPVKQSDYLSRWFKPHWPAAVERLMGQIKFDRVYRLTAKLDVLWHRPLWKRILDDSERSLQQWTIAITLFLLLGIVVVFISASTF